MAKVILSALLDDLSGKLSGSVFQTTVGGLQLRNKVSPRNPRSPAQQRSRANFSYATRSWNDLTPTEIASWNDNAPEGVPGISFYLDVNSKIQSAGFPLLREYTGSGTIDILPITWNVLTLDDSVTNPLTAPDPLPAGQYCSVFATAPLSPGTSFISPSAYVLIQTFPPGTETNFGVNFGAAYVARFGFRNDGTVNGLKAYIFEPATGLCSATVFGQGISPIEP